jgi:hypothetical protein
MVPFLLGNHHRSSTLDLHTRCSHMCCNLLLCSQYLHHRFQQHRSHQHIGHSANTIYKWERITNSSYRTIIIGAALWICTHVVLTCAAICCCAVSICITSFSNTGAINTLAILQTKVICGKRLPKALTGQSSSSQHSFSQG